MKKISLTLLMLALSASLFAQKWDFGLRTGPLVTIATVLDNADKSRLEVNQRGSSGFEFGLQANQKFDASGQFAFHTGAVIVRKGYDFTVADSTINSRITTVQIPLGLRMKTKGLGESGKLAVATKIGTALDLNLFYNETIIAGGETKVFQDASKINKIGATFFFGGGVDFETNAGTVELMVTYNHGLSNINNRKKAVLDNAVVKLNYLTFGLGYFF